MCFISTVFSIFYAAANANQLLLPKPKGTFEVGVGTTELIDASRYQPLTSVVEDRKIMVSLFYPVTSHLPVTTVNYMPPETAAFEDSFQRTNFSLPSPNGTFEKLALQVASKSPRNQRIPDFPIVLFSPAEGTSRLFYNVIAQTIASQGYIVITIDAPHDVDIVQFNDGSVALINETAAVEETPADIEIAMTARAQDASFVLDQLSNTTVISQLIPGCLRALNTRKVAMFGHSLGGAATAAAMLNDSRIAGGIAIDGALFGPVVDEGLDKPFMFMAHTNHTRADNNANSDPDNSWFEIWPKLRAWKADIIVANSMHYTFSDFPIVLETLGIVPNATTAALLQVTGMDGMRALEIVTAYIGAFMDMVLKGKGEGILKGPVDEFPEVTFER